MKLSDLVVSTMNKWTLHGTLSCCQQGLEERLRRAVGNTRNNGPRLIEPLNDEKARQYLRHSAASRMAAGGATDQTLQALLGWMSPKMIERYSHVRAEAKRRAVAVFDVVSSDSDSPQNPPQSPATVNPNIM